jgi:hypothetical protein
MIIFLGQVGSLKPGRFNDHTSWASWPVKTGTFYDLTLLSKFVIQIKDFL